MIVMGCCICEYEYIEEDLKCCFNGKFVFVINRFYFIF